MNWIYHLTMMKFSEWIIHELNDRGWSRSEAARRGGISPSMFDKVINNSSKPGLSFMMGVSRAFGVSLIEVLERSGAYSPDPTQEEWDKIFIQLSPDDQQELLGIARLKLTRRRTDPGFRSQSNVA